MAEMNYKLSYEQSFVFKLRFNKLLTKENVIQRAIKNDSTLNENYNNPNCPNCKLYEEDLRHVATCPNTNIFWKINKRRLLSIINSYSIMSKHDKWNENWMPYSRKIKIFPIWTDHDACHQFYDGFHCDNGKLGMIPNNLNEVLEDYKISKTWRFNCIYDCYTQIIKTLHKCWLNRCKIFAKGYIH